MNRLFIILAIGFLSIGLQKSIKAQCNVNASVYPDTVCAGEPISLTSSSNCGFLMINNFNNGLIGQGWSSTTANPVFINPCGSGPNGAYLWVGTTASTQRTLVTNTYDVSIGGCTIKWDMRYGLVAGSGPCEDPDATNEGVHLQYSINNGTSWSDFPGPNTDPTGPNTIIGPFVTTTPGSGGYWTPVVTSSQQNNSPLYHWHTYECTIPAVASTINTQFRWAQLSNSNAGWDAWGIDEVEISCADTSINNVLWSTGSAVFNPAQLIMPPHPLNIAYDTAFIVHVWNSLNPLGVYDTVWVHVNPIPSVDLGVDTIINWPSSLTLDAGNPNATWLWSTGGVMQAETLDSLNLTIGVPNEISVLVYENGCTGKDTIIITFISNTSIDNDFENAKVNIFPNPSNGEFTIVFEELIGDTYMEVIDLTGKLIYSKMLKAQVVNFNKFDLRTLSSGTYYIRLSNNNSINTLQIIIE